MQTDYEFTPKGEILILKKVACSVPHTAKQKGFLLMASAKDLAICLVVHGNPSLT